MKRVRVIILVCVAVVLSVASSIFFLKGEIRESQNAQAGVRMVRSGPMKTRPLADASQQTVGLPPKATETDTSQQPKEPGTSVSSRTESKANVKPQADAKASLPAAASPEVKQQIAQTYDRMFSVDSNKLLQSPFTAAHNLAEKEAVDETWAPEANRLIADGYSDFSGRFEFSMINCRTDICEVRVNSLPGGEYSGDMELVQSRLDALMQQPSFQEKFDDTSFVTNILGDGMPVMVIFLSRK